MQLAEGTLVDLRYYGAHDQVSSITGVIIDHDQVGVLIQPKVMDPQMFPWTSVQRLIVKLPNDIGS